MNVSESLVGQKRQRVEISSAIETQVIQPANNNENRIAMPHFLVSEIIMSEKRDDREELATNMHPHEFLIQRLRQDGIHVTAVPYTDCDFFLEATPEDLEAYTLDVIGAVRSGDIEALKLMKSERNGDSWECRNRFGESLLHLACRRQKLEVVRFLLDEAQASAFVCDDFGRTPLHDACWTATPNFELVDCIVARAPDLLFVKDKRGHSPLFYARREHWRAWITHLAARSSMLKPRLLSYSSKSPQQMATKIIPPAL